MPSQFSNSIGSFLARSVVESLRVPRPVARQINTSYVQGTYATNSGNLYIAVQSGIGVTGAGAGPIQTSGTVTDGSVTWLGLGAYSVADGSVSSNLYVGFGRDADYEWTDPEVPEAVDVSPDANTILLDRMTFALRVAATDIAVGMARRDWVTATVYDQFDADSEDNSGAIVMNGTLIYKCLDNNGGADSTTAPTGTSSNPIQTADGYIWKYMGAVSGTRMFRFQTTNYVPFPDDLPTVVWTEGALSTFQNSVQSATPFDVGDTITVSVVGAGSGATAVARTSTAGSDVTVDGFFAGVPGSGYGPVTFATAHVDGALGSGATLTPVLLAGALDDLTIDTAGTLYDDATVIIIGDGTGATATVTLDGGTGAVVATTVTAPGSGYTWAYAVVIPGTKAAAAIAVLAPNGGHGSQLELELDANAMLISKNVEIGNPNIPVDGGAVDGSFRQYFLISGIVNDVRNASSVIGPAHPDYADPQPGQNKYLRGGNVLYLSNIEAIVHSNTQEEVIKIAVSNTV